MKIIIQKTLSILLVLLGLAYIGDFLFAKSCNFSYIKEVGWGSVLIWLGVSAFKLLLKGKKVRWWALINDHSGIGFGPLITSKKDKRNVSNRIALPLILTLLLIFIIGLVYILVKYNMEYAPN